MKKRGKPRADVPRKYHWMVRRALRELQGEHATSDFYSTMADLLAVPERKKPVVRAQAYFLLLKYREKINLKDLEL